MEQHAPGPESSVNETAAWEKLRRLAEKHRASDDQDIAKALEAALVAEAQELAKTASSRPAWLQEFPLVAGFFGNLSEASETTDLADSRDQLDSTTQILSEEPLPNDVETAERLIREAHLFSMRGDKSKAKELLDQAEKAAPRSGAVLVALGDVALERHNVKEAVRLFALAKDVEPGNVVYERKHADAVFRQTQGLIFDPNVKPGAITDAASAKAGVVLSFMVPGLGQIVTGDTAKGVAFLAMWIGCIVTSVLIGFDGLTNMLGMQRERQGSLLVLLPLALGALMWLSAVLDASAQAKQSERRTIVRPTPPSEGGNKPFE